MCMCHTRGRGSVTAPKASCRDCSVRALRFPTRSGTFPSGHMDVVRSTTSRSADSPFSRAGAGRRTSHRSCARAPARTGTSGTRFLGSLHVTMDDGTELVIREETLTRFLPGHEVWSSATSLGIDRVHEPPHVRGGPGDPGDRVLATVLFSDIVDSTAILERLGDHAWTSLLDEHNVRIRAAIERFRGREFAPTGDAFLALFDGAAKAVRAGALMDPSVADLGLRVRVGIHTSEVEFVGGQPRGVGVHAAARLAALAGPGEVFVSGVTRDLLDGSGLSLESRGEHELKGLSRRPDDLRAPAIGAPGDDPARST